VGRRSRAGRKGEKLAAPTADYTDAAGNVLTLRGALTPATRREYAALTGGGSTREDSWHRAVEFLFERLAVRWVVSGVETARQKELLLRFRVASAEERAWIREVLREHLAEWFPDVEAP
jgi:hypothetical protein